MIKDKIYYKIKELTERYIEDGESFEIAAYDSIEEVKQIFPSLKEKSKDELELLKDDIYHDIYK